MPWRRRGGRPNRRHPRRGSLRGGRRSHAAAARGGGIVVDPSPARRAALAALGARQLLDPTQCDVVAASRDLTGGRGADASIDAAGVPESFAAMLHGTRVDGTSVVVAIHHKPVVIPVRPPDAGGAPDRCGTFGELLRGGDRRDGPRQLPAHRWVEIVPFEGVIKQGIERLRRQQGIKIVVDVAGAAGRPQ